MYGLTKIANDLTKVANNPERLYAGDPGTFYGDEGELYPAEEGGYVPEELQKQFKGLFDREVDLYKKWNDYQAEGRNLFSEERKNIVRNNAGIGALSGGFIGASTVAGSGKVPQSLLVGSIGAAIGGGIGRKMGGDKAERVMREKLEKENHPLYPLRQQLTQESDDLDEELLEFMENNNIYQL